MLLIFVNAQPSKSIFAAGEAQLVYDLLNGLGCIGNDNCRLKDFVPTAQCDFVQTEIQCSEQGRLIFL
jgi:hypothetical protein